MPGTAQPQATRQASGDPAGGVWLVVALAAADGNPRRPIARDIAGARPRHRYPVCDVEHMENLSLRHTHIVRVGLPAHLDLDDLNAASILGPYLGRLPAG